MASKPQFWRISNFTGGVNYITDPRELAPNSDKQNVAEFQELTNMDIDKNGALITSTGYELVSSIVGTGGVDLLVNYEKSESERYLGIVHGGNLHTIEPSVTAWNNRGSLGATATKYGAAVYKGTGAVRRLIVGNDDTGVQIKKFDGTTLSNIGTADFNGSYILETFQGRLFAGKNATVIYSDVEDETSTGGTVGFNDIVSGLKTEAKRLNVFTRTYNQPIFFQYDDSFNISEPLKDPFERDFGAMGYKALTQRGANVRYWAEDNRVYNLGSEQGINELGLPRPLPISEKIAPVLNFNNLEQKDLAVAIPYRSADQWWLATPYGSSETNDIVWVFNERFNCWTTRSGFTPSALALFRNNEYKEELYWGNALAPQLFKFNNSYSYNGSGYIRRAKFKKFTFGDARVYKEMHWINLAGSMYLGTTFFVKVTADDQTTTFQIDNSFLERSRFGDGYVGDSDIGDIYLGGSEEDDGDGIGFKRYRAHIQLPLNMREANQYEIEIFNSAAEQPWKIDELSFEFEYKPTQMRKDSFIANTIVAS